MVKVKHQQLVITTVHTGVFRKVSVYTRPERGHTLFPLLNHFR